MVVRDLQSHNPSPKIPKKNIAVTVNMPIVPIGVEGSSSVGLGKVEMVSGVD